MSDAIPVSDLAVVTAGNFDYVLVIDATTGAARKALLPTAAQAATDLAAGIDGIMADAQADADAALAGIGYHPPVTYGSGISLTSTRETVEYAGNVYAPLASALPFTTTGTFETAKFRVIQGVVLADLKSGTLELNNKFYWRAASGGSIPVAKAFGEGSPGVVEVIHNDSTGYLFHLLAGASMAYPAAMFGIGMDNGNGTGILLAKKAGGIGIAIDQQATVTDATAYGIHATQRSTAAPLVRLEQQVNSGAALLQLLSFSTSVDANQQLLYVGDKDGEAGRIFAADGIMRWRRNVIIQDKDGTTASKLVLTTNPGVVASQKSEVYLSKNGLEHYAYSGSPGVWFATRILPQSGGMKLQCAPATSTLGTATWATMIDVRNNALGFYGTAAIAKPTISGSRGGNAALASLLTQLANLGLISNGTTA